MEAAYTGLAENRCLQRKQRGAKLLQIGEQEVAFGAKFRARVVLDIEVRLPQSSPCCAKNCKSRRFCLFRHGKSLL